MRAIKISASNTICSMKFSLLQERVSLFPPPEKETVVQRKGNNQEVLSTIFPPKYVSAAYWENKIRMRGQKFSTNCVLGNGRMEKAHGCSERPVTLLSVPMSFSYGGC